METFNNSWHLVTPIDNHHIVHHYICSCGSQKSISVPTTCLDYPNLKCKNCANSYYIDYDSFRKRETVKYWKSINLSHKFLHDENGWHLIYFIELPILDYSSRKFIPTEHEVVKFSLFIRGRIKEEVCDDSIMKLYVYDQNNTKMSDLLYQNFPQKLLNFFYEEFPENLQWIDPSEIETFDALGKLQLYSYFLSNSTFKDVNLFYWNFKKCDDLYESVVTLQDALNITLNGRHERSVKKALYKSYLQHNTVTYNPIYDNMICKWIEDSNITVRLLNISVEFKQIFTAYSIYYIYSIFEWMKNIFTEKQIELIFLSASQNTNEMRKIADTMNMMYDNELQGFIEEHFQKPRANITALHDEIVRVYTIYTGTIKLKEQANEPFEYSEHILNMQIEFEGLSFRLPQDPMELYLWGSLLNNCLGSYVGRVFKSNALIFGVFHEDKLKLALNISHGKIVEAKSRWNNSVPENDLMIINSWFEKRTRLAT